MSESRPFPPSPRRLALARRAGLTAASPMLVAALACAAGIAAACAFARSAADALGTWIAAACAGRADALAPGGIAHATATLAAPIVGSAALVAALAHLGQTRALWL
ncbi:MAG TPA: EscU/YscU/HrcU family type III secretion system export apparatus switch protein, partial [Kofleriaceae bacterium]|nr:EscU/YscU/HrcU family type III secretion system export apparatus switch protein [Kofleriaceae bacterium]